MQVGVVAIGRNEGERLVRCLDSVVKLTPAVVYVDSNSTDDSIANARKRGVECVSLDLKKPFTAARARDEGFERLRELHPDVEFVLFVDGDCEVQPDFLSKALEVMARRPEVAAVCGRRRERFPEATVYNKLCDMEWDTPVGDADACGGDALMRVGPFVAVGLFRRGLIAGEEPELCHRLRMAGHKIVRLDAEMTLHDAAMTRFGQWWQRSKRAGFAFACVYHLTRDSGAPIWKREYQSNWIWGPALLLLPPLALVLAPFTWGLSLLLLLAFVYLGWKVFRYRRRRGDPASDACRYALFTVFGKVPQLFGQIKYHRDPGAGLIEYK